MSTDPPPSPTTTPADYEFTPAQNRTLEQLSGNLLFTGSFLIIVTLVFHVVLLARWIAQGVPMYERFQLIYVLWPLLLLYCGWQFIATGLEFRHVVKTQGSDISFLMEGLERLNDAFGWLNFLPQIWLLFAAIAGIVGVIIALVHWIGY